MASAQGDYTGNVNAFFGHKFLDENDWPAEDQDEFGIEVDFRKKGWPVSIAIDLLYAKGEEITLPPFLYMSTTKDESIIFELNTGVRKIWDNISIPVRPFIGGGISVIYARMKRTNYFPLTTFETSESGMGAGVWFGGGVYWTFGGQYNIGLDLKYSSATVTLSEGAAGGYDVDAGGAHVGLLAGYHW